MAPSYTNKRKNPIRKIPQQKVAQANDSRLYVGGKKSPKCVTRKNNPNPHRWTSETKVTHFGLRFFLRILFKKELLTSNPVSPVKPLGKNMQYSHWLCNFWLQGDFKPRSWASLVHSLYKPQLLQQRPLFSILRPFLFAIFSYFFLSTIYSNEKVGCLTGDSCSMNSISICLH